MGRKRRPGDEWMPRRVYRGRSAFEYRPLSGGCIKLCPLSADRDTVLREHRKHTAESEPGTYAAMQKAYLASAEFAALSVHTRRAYERYAKQLKKVFGIMLVDDIQPADCRAWLDVRGPAKGPVLANREFALLGTVFRWGYERGHCAVRPTLGVRRYQETPRDRIVTPAELEAFLEGASARMRAYVAVKILTGLRQGEILAMSLQDFRREDGILVDTPSKGGRRRLIEWTDALREAAAAVLVLEPRVRAPAWPTAAGGRLTQAGFQVEWQRTMRRYVDKGGERFHEHDLRAAAVGELDLRHAQMLLGHQRQTTTSRHYRRAPERVKPAR